MEELVIALKTGKVPGAALDVLVYEKTSFEAMDAYFYPEPLKYLVEAENVILTPLIAGWIVESKYKLATVLSDKSCEHFFAGDFYSPCDFESPSE